MFAKKGFSFIEVLSPCPTLYQRRNKMGDGLDTMKFYKEVSKIRNGAATKDVALTKSGEITVASLSIANAATTAICCTTGYSIHSVTIT